MRFTDFDQIWMLTHGRTTTATEHEVGHADDFICLAIAGFFGWPKKRIQRVDDAQYVRMHFSPDPRVLNIVCDFIYNPSPGENVMVFDHHDPAQPTEKCSAHLLMEELSRQGMIEKVPQLMSEISAWDVIGPSAVPTENRPDPDRYLSVLSAEPKEGFDFETSFFILEKLSEAGSVREFIDKLFFAENELGRTARQIHSELISKREETLNGITRTAVVKESPSGIRYAWLSNSPAGLTRELFDRLRVDILIHPNERTENAFSIVRNSDGRLATKPVSELVEVAQKQIVFVHPGGFLLVVYPPFDIR